MDLRSIVDRHRPTLASTIFNQRTGDNTKPDGRAKDNVVAYSVVIAGWLIGPGPSRSQEGGVLRPNEAEDYHYDLWLDGDFLARTYNLSHLVGEPYWMDPLATAETEGARNLLSVEPTFVYPIIKDNTLNAASLTWPGNSIQTVELNAWHLEDRKTPPEGWVTGDITQSELDGNAWPFQPRVPLNVTSDDVLSANDYVIVSGTLWVDTPHIGSEFDDDPATPIRRCWNSKRHGHGGWLEIHPVDSIRRVDPPEPRKTNMLVNACESAYGGVWEGDITPILNDGATPPPDAILHCERWVDTRFTDPWDGAWGTWESLTLDSPPKLHVRLHTSSHAQLMYTVWYEIPEPGSTPPPAPDPNKPCVHLNGRVDQKEPDRD